jgi:hypothetical protein
MPCSHKKTNTCHVHAKRQTHAMFTQKDKHMPCSHKKTNTCHVHAKRQTHAMFTQKDKHMLCSHKKTNTCHVHTKRQKKAMFTQKDKHMPCSHKKTHTIFAHIDSVCNKSNKTGATLYCLFFFVDHINIFKLFLNDTIGRHETENNR